MAWIESHQSLKDHRKTGRLMRQLKIGRHEAIGLLQCFWWWCLDNAPDGDLTDLEPQEMADGAEWKKDAKALIDALIYAGFVDASENNLAIHDWWDFAGKLVEKRIANALRMKRAREARKHAQIMESAQHVQDTCDARSEHVQDTFGTRAGATQHNTTQQNTTEEHSSQNAPNEKGYPSDFEDVWQCWRDNAGPVARARNESKKDAFGQWKRLNKIQKAQLLHAIPLSWKCPDYAKDGGNYAPHLLRYIKSEVFAEVPLPFEQTADLPSYGAERGFMHPRRDEYWPGHSTEVFVGWKTRYENWMHFAEHPEEYDTLEKLKGVVVPDQSIIEECKGHPFWDKLKLDSLAVGRDIKKRLMEQEVQVAA